VITKQRGAGSEIRSATRCDERSECVESLSPMRCSVARVRRRQHMRTARAVSLDARRAARTTRRSEASFHSPPFGFARDSAVFRRYRFAFLRHSAM